MMILSFKVMDLMSRYRLFVIPLKMQNVILSIEYIVASVTILRGKEKVGVAQRYIQERDSAKEHGVIY